ncbi:MAG: hypothetical protein AAF622_20695 [Cyanobacteria bacterium P01_C01_bin.147]
MRLAGIFALTLAMPNAPAFAQEDVFSLPDGCEAFVTVQYKLCTVSHHYTCEADPEGVQHRVDIDDEGPYFIGTIDEETQWLESVDIRLGIVDKLDANPVDPASFTELTRNGRDDFDFSTTSEFGETVFYRGRDRLTGETVVIDDVPLLRTETFARATRPDGSLVWESQGNEYIHLDWRLFLAGQSVIRTPEQSFEDDDAPVAFHFPGEGGFLSSSPEFNCNAFLL